MTPIVVAEIPETALKIAEVLQTRIDGVIYGTRERGSFTDTSACRGKRAVLSDSIATNRRGGSSSADLRLNSSGSGYSETRCPKVSHDT